MLKGILLSTILMACVCAGRMVSNLRKKRYETIGEILAAMRVLRLRMLNSMEPVGILLRKSDSVLFRELGNNLWEGGGLEEAWLKLRGNTSKRDKFAGGLNLDDLKMLDVFFVNLGKSGREGQKELFASVIERMEEMQNHARSRYLDASRLYTALGALVGIGVCVLIV